MASLTNGITYDGRFDVPPSWVNGQSFALSRKIDCSSTTLSAATAYDIFEIGNGDNSNQGYRVTSVEVEVHTAEGSAGTLDVGDEDSATRFETDANINSAAITQSIDARITYTSQKSITITPSIELDTAIFSVTVYYTCIDLTATT